MKKKFMMLCLLIIITLCSIISATTLYYVKTLTKKIVSEQKENAVQYIKDYIVDFDKKLNQIEINIFNQYKDLMPEITSEIISKGSIENITVDELRNMVDRYNVDEIYLINKDGVIINSTYDKDIGLDLKEKNQFMNDFTNDVYGKGVSMTHRALVSKYNKLNKYIYYSPKGSDYIVEISFDIYKYLSNKHGSSYTEFLFIDGLKKFANQNIYLNAVEVYDVTNYEGWSILLSGKRLDNSVMLNYLSSNKTGYQFSNGDTIKDYKLVEDITGSDTYFGKKLMIEMEYDFSSINGFARNVIGAAFISGIILAVFALMILSTFFDKFIGVRINQINNKLELLEKGIYPEDITFKSSDELTMVANNINQMKYSIKEREDELIKNLRELERMAVELKESKEIIEYDKLKTEFFANLSHEFKTPLNILLSSLQLIELYSRKQMIKDPEEKLKTYSKIMRQNSYRLLRLVNNLIDLTKIDAYFYDIELHNHDIVSITEGIVNSTMEYGKYKNIEIEFNKGLSEKYIACDPDKIERVLLNLISNAIKFTDDNGHIEVSIKELNDNVVISVRDNGMGIPEDKLEVIFQRFRQVDKSFSRNAEGSGIGLSLVKALIDLHNGQISVVSEYGKGSEFIVTLPSIVLNESYSDNYSNASEDRRIEKMRVEFSDIYS